MVDNFCFSMSHISGHRAKSIIITTINCMLSVDTHTQRNKKEIISVIFNDVFSPDFA